MLTKIGKREFKHLTASLSFVHTLAANCWVSEICPRSTAITSTISRPKTMAKAIYSLERSLSEVGVVFDGGVVADGGVVVGRDLLHS